MQELSNQLPLEPLAGHADKAVATINQQLLLGTRQNSSQADSRPLKTAFEERRLADHDETPHERGLVNNFTRHTRGLPPMPIAQTALSGVRIVSRNPSKLITKYAQLWNDIDRLELALRKVETAKWEHERIEEKLLFQVEEENGEKTRKKKAMLSERLQRDLARFGLNEDRVKKSMVLLTSPDQSTGLKVEIDHKVTIADTPFDILESLGFPMQIDSVRFSKILLWNLLFDSDKYRKIPKMLGLRDGCLTI